ncbi:MAG: class I mannose-6-phosphate isomerase [Bacteroidia bacterium]
MSLHPLRFHPIYKDKLWGGQKIREVLGKDFGALPNCGESWELSGVPGNISVVAEGPLAGRSLVELIQTYRHELVGQPVYDRYGDTFPLLIKFLDAADDLSIQVHPGDDLALARHQSLGKTEMWYILDADPGATLITGFARPLDKDTYLDYFRAGRLMELLNIEPATPGDVFFTPAGRVHSLGRGLLLAEIQQTSDVTYRIYDFDRTDEQGRTRELHVEEALDAIDYTHYPSYRTSYDDRLNADVPLVEAEYFATHRLRYDSPTTRDYRDRASFTVAICVEGALELHHEGSITPLQRGDTVLIPAAVQTLDLRPTAGAFTLLETWVP